MLLFLSILSHLIDPKRVFACCWSLVDKPNEWFADVTHPRTRAENGRVPGARLGD